MTLWRTYLGLVGSEDAVAEPPERVLNIAVMGGIAHVAVVDVDVHTMQVAAEPVLTF